MAPLQNQEFLDTIDYAKSICVDLRPGFFTPAHLLFSTLSHMCGAYNFLDSHCNTQGLAQELREFMDATDKACKPKYNEVRSQPATGCLSSLRASRIIHRANELAERFQAKTDTLHLLWALLQEPHSLACIALVHHQNVKEGDQPLPDAESLSKEWSNEIEALLVRAGSNRPALMSLTSDSDKRNGQVKYWRQQLNSAGKMLLNNQVIQGSAVERVANALIRSWADVGGTDRPMASFLFVGPRGSGKRSLARNIASFLYNSPERLHSISLGDFSEQVKASILLKGEDSDAEQSQESELTRLAQEYPYSIIYLEDVERANSKTMDMIHRLLKHGHILDAQGKVVDFRGNVIVLSLSIDPMYFEREKNMGLRSNVSDNSGTQEGYERLLMEDLERVLRADTLGLVDEVVFFPPLTDDELTERAKVLVKELSDNVRRQYRIELVVEDSVYDFLMRRLRELGKNTGNLRRLFSREVSNAVAQALLANKLKAGHKAVLQAPAAETKCPEGQWLSIKAE